MDQRTYVYNDARPSSISIAISTTFLQALFFQFGHLLPDRTSQLGGFSPGPRIPRKFQLNFSSFRAQFTMLSLTFRRTNGIRGMVIEVFTIALNLQKALYWI